MKLNSIFPIYILLVLASFSSLLTSCKHDSSKTVTANSLDKADTLQNKYAKCFRVIYSKNEVEIDIIHPETKANIKKYKISKNPSSDYATFHTDLQRIITGSSTHIGMLNALNLQGVIVAVPEYEYLCRPVNKSKIKNVGDIFRSNAEAYMTVSPEIIFYSGFDLNAPIFHKFEQANMKTFLMYEWKESHPLGRAEWIKIYGILFNKEKEANDLFNSIETRYQHLKEKLITVKENPTVLIGTYYNDLFNAPAGESYMATLFKDARVNYIYADKKGTGSLELSLEEVIMKNKDVDFWLNMAVTNKEDLVAQNDKFQLMQPLQTGKMYSYMKNLNCFWENSPIEPDVLLEDLGKIFHPELFDNQDLKYYSKVE